MALKSAIDPDSEAAEYQPRRAAKTPRSPRNAPAPLKRRNQRLAHDLTGLGCIAAGVLLWALLFVGDRSGSAGHAIVAAMRMGFGIGAYLVPAGVIYAGVVMIAGRHLIARWEIALGTAIIVLSVLSWWHYGHTRVADQFTNASLMSYGGYVGGGISAGLRALLGATSPLIYFTIIVGCLIWTLDVRVLDITAGVAGAARKAWGAAAGAVSSGSNHLKLSQISRRERQADVANSGSADMAEAEDESAATMPAVPKLRLAKAPRKAALEEVVAADSLENDLTATDQMDPFDELPTVSTSTIIKPPALFLTAPIEKPRPPSEPTRSYDRLGEGSDHINADYQLPSVELLNPSPPPPPQLESMVAERQQVLMQCLNDFKIGANVQRVAMGPTITRYEVQLEPGILVKKIVALADNLAMSLAAIDVRVEAPIPGKSAIGIEVPNDKPQLVSIRECLETPEFMDAPSKLTFALGKDVAGNFKYADLARMPHLLVGGSTNSGKSVCLNAIITSMVYRATPREVQFVMIDPKRVELSLYDGIPHLLSPVIKDTKMAAGILRSVIKEMDRRYELFARLGTRNLEGYNNKVEPHMKLSFIVVIIDELADLMMTQGAEVELLICRLAQLARATGIHLILATQRPSVDVITGTIKANIASRIAFAVATAIDSRTILDSTGADRLIGRGDMMFLPIDASKPMRVQGCFVGEAETDKLVEYLKTQEEPNYTMTPTDSASGYGDDDDDGSSGEGGNAEGSNDELFEICVRWVVNQKEASTSSLQRKFKIGYTRAARIVDTMEAKGIVGPMDGVKRREVMLAPENVELYFAGRQQGVAPSSNDPF